MFTITKMKEKTNCTHDRESLTTCYNYGYKSKQIYVYFNQSASDQVPFKLYKVIRCCRLIKKTRFNTRISVHQK